MLKPHQLQSYSSINLGSEKHPQWSAKYFAKVICLLSGFKVVHQWVAKLLAILIWPLAQSLMKSIFSHIIKNGCDQELILMARMIIEHKKKGLSKRTMFIKKCQKSL